MKSSEIRSQFLSYFEKHGHRVVPSSRLIPESDPTLLFTNAGMNQFKNTFLGLEKRDYTRAATAQKCLRAGGKHNDLENVGFTARHHTFFEMLGNFSFGDYFKREAISYAWEFITKTLSLPKDRIYVTVFQNDDEAADIWHKDIGFSKDRIFRFGEKDNFWRMGSSGPCGPCSEIFFDLDPSQKEDPKLSIEKGTDRIIEFWNLVFMQFNESEDGKKTPLPKPSVDTGMGLERLSMILQGKTSNYDIDLFQSLIGAAEKFSGVKYGRDSKEDLNVAMRVVADHARAAAFLISDGVLPSNDGRGYVLRRIMRRAIRYAQKISDKNGLYNTVVEKVISEMGGAYPELHERESHIVNTIREEEKRFLQTLDQGLSILNDEFENMKKTGSKVLDGKFSFKLYDTFGFPLDLTQLVARERGLSVDVNSFSHHLEEARQKARNTWKGQGLSMAQAHLVQWTQKILKSHGPTEFTGYRVINDDAKIIGLSDGQKETSKLETGGTGLIVTAKTCFYAESGGQVGDTGRIKTADGELEVLDCTKMSNIYLHQVKVVDGFIQLDSEARLEVDFARRRQIMNNHSATHLLHSALRQVLGDHVTQAGSLVAAERLRFDFTHNKAVTAQEQQAIENLVNGEISHGHKVDTQLMSTKDAIAAGALAMFGEKYGDEVRVLTMGEFSKELCGGTHVESTSDIRAFKIVSESSVSSGVRRIEAITGETAVHYLLKHARENIAARAACNLTNNWQQFMESTDEVSQIIEASRTERKNLERQMKSKQAASLDVDEWIKTAESFKIKGQKAQFVFETAAIADRNVLSQTVDRIRDKLKTGVVILIGTSSEGTYPIIVSVSKDLVGPLNAGKILAEVAKELGGKGGGRPDFAQGAGKDLAGIDKARQTAIKFLQS